ncbi:hypothetical protein ACLECR_09650 [Lonsdalea quercina]|uniref:hypothetical protein n=1 Tax=Lonsdalea quercina TaxID=71657 RepID=UPI0039765D88
MSTQNTRKNNFYNHRDIKNPQEVEAFPTLSAAFFLLFIKLGRLLHQTAMNNLITKLSPIRLKALRYYGFNNSFADHHHPRNILNPETFVDI